MKRILFKLALFLLLGAIVNVAVAWGSAFLVDVSLGSVESVVMDDSTSKYNWCAGRYMHNSTAERAILYSTAEVAMLFKLSGLEGSGHNTRGSDIEDLIPPWAMNLLYEPQWPKRDNELPKFVYFWAEYTVDGRGWPMRAVWGGTCTFTSRYSKFDGDKQVGLIEPGDKQLYAAIPIKSGLMQNSRHSLVLPLMPIWPGFAINTVFYAAILWLLTLGPFTARRIIRRKRGRCIKCGYDLRGAGHDVCPECGVET